MVNKYSKCMQQLSEQYECVSDVERVPPLEGEEGGLQCGGDRLAQQHVVRVRMCEDSETSIRRIVDCTHLL